MLAPRGAAFLLLHLALQPWLVAGAQATPQGKWARAAARATGLGPLVLGASRPCSSGPSRGTSSARRWLLGPRSAPLCPSGARVRAYCDWKLQLEYRISETRLSSIETSSLTNSLRNAELFSLCREVGLLQS